MRRSRLLIGIVMAGLSLMSYYGYRQVNPVTGESQHITLTQDQEVALGLESAPQMAEEFGGLDPAEFLSSHPDRGNRQERIREAITNRFSADFSNARRGATSLRVMTFK